MAGCARRWRFIAGREEVFKLAENIFRPLAEFGAFFNEIMATLAARRIDAARDGKNLAAVFVGEISGDQGAAAQVGFDDDGAEGHPRDDPVADRKGLLVSGAV